jgi:hypothetical protein
MKMRRTWVRDDEYKESPYNNAMYAFLRKKEARGAAC